MAPTSPMSALEKLPINRAADIARCTLSVLVLVDTAGHLDRATRAPKPLCVVCPTRSTSLDVQQSTTAVHASREFPPSVFWSELRSGPGPPEGCRRSKGEETGSAQLGRRGDYPGDARRLCQDHQAHNGSGRRAVIRVVVTNPRASARSKTATNCFSRHDACSHRTRSEGACLERREPSCSSLRRAGFIDPGVVGLRAGCPLLGARRVTSIPPRSGVHMLSCGRCLPRRCAIVRTCTAR